MNRFRYIFLLAAAWMPSNAMAQQELLQPDSLDKYINRGMQTWKIPGMAVCIIKDGKVWMSKGYGVRSIGKPEKVDAETVFSIASIGKQFTGAALALLEARGKASLDDKLLKWYPAFTMNNVRYREDINLTDLLAHRSGWRTFQGDLLNTESDMPIDIMLEKFGRQEPVYPIRTRYSYSNFGYLLAGKAMEGISGQKWDDLMKENFFQPLGMNRTFIEPQTISAAVNRTGEHTLKDGQVISLPPSRPDPQTYGGFFSSANDMSKWLSVLLNKGMWEGKEVLPQKALGKMWNSYAILGKGRGADRVQYFKTYGLGWTILQYNNYELVEHSGAYAGALSMLALVPSLNAGIMIMTNQGDHVFTEVLKYQVIDALIGRKAPDYIETISTLMANRVPQVKEEKQERVVESLSVPLSKLAGKYTCDMYGGAEIKQVGTDLILTLQYHPGLEGKLSSSTKESVTCTYSNLMFGKADFPVKIVNGQVQEFTLSVDSFVEGGTYVFKRKPSR